MKSWEETEGLFENNHHHHVKVIIYRERESREEGKRSSPLIYNERGYYTSATASKWQCEGSAIFIISHYA